MGVDAAGWSIVFNRLTSVLDGRDIIDQTRRSLGATVIGALSEDEAVRAAGDRGRLIWDAAPNARFAKELRQICSQTAQMIDNKRRSFAQRHPAR
jgi:MinD-like ATPase involved in chromosome partitioning or flagellar assembly